MSHITVITYADYENDKNGMKSEDLALFNAMAYTSSLNDTEEIIASLKGIFPADYSDIAEEKGVTGMAHNISNIGR